MFAAQIETTDGADIRLFSAMRTIPDELLKRRITEKLNAGERLIFVKPLLLRPVALDRDVNPDSTQIQFMREFISKVLKRFYLKESVYYSSNRTQVYRDVKYCIYQILRDHTTLSLNVIGKVHNRDHSTVVNGLRRFSELIETDVDFKQTYLDVINILNEF